MLREFPRELLEKAGADADYIRRYDDVMDVFRNYMQQKECNLLAPFSRDHKYAVAYFSARRMVKEYIEKFYSKGMREKFKEEEL
jgi:starch phosphorylase